MTPPVLAFPNFTKSFVLHTNASIEGLGAVLEQEQEDGRLHPVAYASRSLSIAICKMVVRGKAAWCMVW